MIDAVVEATAVEKPTAVIAEQTTWEEFPRLWRELLAEVWEVVRGNDAIAPGRNVMFYRDDLPSVEVGAEAAGPFEPIGRVVPGVLPAGRVARTTLRGAYDGIGAAHAAVIDWCDRHGLVRAGPRWEIYGHWTPDEAQQEVEIFYLLR